MTDISATPFDFPYQEAIVNFRTLQDMQVDFARDREDSGLLEDTTLYPVAPAAGTKEYSVVGRDLVYSRRKLPSDHELGSGGNSAVLSYSEFDVTYVDDAGNYYVATSGRVYIPDRLVGRLNRDSPYAETDATLWAPGAGYLPPGDGELSGTPLGTTGVSSTRFIGIRPATPAEIQKAKLLREKALADGYTLDENGLTLSPPSQCFLSGTPITMADGSRKPIEEITPDDLVLSYDKDGHLKPGRVTRVFRNQSTHILDFWGTGVTPGHVYLCGDGPFKGQHVALMDILRTDGAIVRDDGTLIRAATGCEAGSMGDRLVQTITGETQPCGRTQIREAGQIRLGTRVITAEGDDISVLDLVFSNGGRLTDDGYIKTAISGEKMPFRWRFSERLPQPEDYILQRSATTLHDIYHANEWEAVGTRLAGPAGGMAAVQTSTGHA